MATLIWKPSPVAFMDTQVVTVAGSRTYTIEAGIPAEVLPEDIAAVTTALQALQGTMATAGAPSISNQGTPATTVYGYKVVAVGQTGDGVPSTETQTATGAATLNGTNFNRITKGALPAAATGWRVLRTTAAGTPSTTGQITSAVLPPTTATFDDTGLAASAYVPAGANPSVDSVVAGPPDA